MKLRLNALFALIVVIVFLAGTAAAQQRTRIRYALGDVISIDELPLLIAAERAKARGVDVEITAFKNEEAATQAGDLDGQIRAVCGRARNWRRILGSRLNR